MQGNTIHDFIIDIEKLTGVDPSIIDGPAGLIVTRSDIEVSWNTFTRFESNTLWLPEGVPPTSARSSTECRRLRAFRVRGRRKILV